MTECINVYRAKQSIAPQHGLCSVCCRAVSVCPSVCHVDVLKRPNLLSNFFIAWWSHHSSFPKGDPTVKFRRAPSTWAPNRWGTRNLRFSTSISEIPIPNTEPTWKKYRWKYRIPIPTPNTDTDPALDSWCDWTDEQSLRYIRVRLLAGTVGNNLSDFWFGCRPKRREIWRCCRLSVVEEVRTVQSVQPQLCLREVRSSVIRGHNLRLNKFRVNMIYVNTILLVELLMYGIVYLVLLSLQIL